MSMLQQRTQATVDGVLPMPTLRSLANARFELESAVANGTVDEHTQPRCSVASVSRLLFATRLLASRNLAPSGLVAQQQGSGGGGADSGSGSGGGATLRSDDASEATMCVICHRGFAAGQYATVLPCKHVFHLYVAV